VQRPSVSTQRPLSTAPAVQFGGPDLGKLFALYFKISAALWTGVAATIGGGIAGYQLKNNQSVQLNNAIEESKEIDDAVLELSAAGLTGVAPEQAPERVKAHQQLLKATFISQAQQIQQSVGQVATEKAVIEALAKSDLTPEELAATEAMLKASDYTLPNTPEERFNKWADTVLAKRTDADTLNAIKITAHDMFQEAENKEGLGNILLAIAVLSATITIGATSLMAISSGLGQAFGMYAFAPFMILGTIIGVTRELLKKKKPAAPAEAPKAVDAAKPADAPQPPAAAKPAQPNPSEVPFIREPQAPPKTQEDQPPSA
jgi:hypothetical protein